MNLIKKCWLIVSIVEKMLKMWIQTFLKQKNDRLIIKSKCAVCGFVKEQEPKGLLSSSGLKAPLNKIPLLGDNLFWVYKNE